MASHPLNYESYPQAEPIAGPEAREQIHTDPDMFGAAIGRGLGQLGQGLEHTSQEGLDVATQQARMDAQTHANELHSWQSDQVTDAQEKFLTLRGKDAELALPQFKSQIDQLHQDARGQAGNPYTAQLVDSEGRRLTDMAYGQASRHAAQQKTVWDTETATDSAGSAGSRAALAAQTTPANVAINANPSVVLGLSRSDDFARQGAQYKGLDGDIEVQRNRGRNVAATIKSVTADGSQTSLQRAIDFFHTQYDRMDPGSRATIEQTLKSQAASYDGQKTADIYMGRGPFLPPGYAQAATNIESGGNPNAATSSGTYKGLGQFSPALETRYGLNESNRGDPASVARAYSQENAENHDALARALGHEPTPADYYLAHQQGVGGAVAHIMQPNLPAWQNMQHTIEGQEKGAGWAKQAIWGNMTPSMKAQFPGGVETVTSGDFAAMWAQRFYGQPIQASGAMPGNGTEGFGVQRLTPQAYFERNKEFVKPGAANFSTPLSPQEETSFRQWITANKVPFDPAAQGPQDYDMRGFWKGLQSGDEHAKSAVDPNDGKLHYPDYWKTPYHETFSNESQWANEKAPHWTGDDKLVTPDGRVLFDDRKPAYRVMPSVNGVQNVAFGGGFNRLNMASDFSETNKGDVIKRITNDPYLLDHPQAMNAAITYTNKIFEAQTASYADMHRALQIQEAQKKMASESAENDYLKQIYAPVANAKPLSVQGIVLDDRLSRESKDRLIDRIAKAGGNPDSYGPGFDNLFHKIHAPEGSSERITDVSQLYDHVGKDISYPAFEKLRDEINLKKTPEGNSESEMKAQFLKDARGKITGTDEGLHIKDPKGDDLYLKFLAQVLPAYDEGRRGTKDKPGKSPSQLLNPDSPDYVGKIITNFKRPMEQWFSDTVHDASGTPATAAKPAFDISTVKSLDDLVGAYRSGKVTKDQADQLAISNGWATRKPSVPIAAKEDAGIHENRLTDILGLTTPEAAVEKTTQQPASSSISSYPSVQDARYAIEHGFGYGTGMEDYYNAKHANVIGSVDADGKWTPKMATGFDSGELADFVNDSKFSKNLDLDKPENWAMKEKLGVTFTRAGLAAEHIPIAKIGFDPHRIALDLLIGDKNPSLGGSYSEKADGIYANIQKADPSSVLHEAIHRGLKIMRDKSPEARDLMSNLPNEEYVVRWIMHKYAGDPEAAGGGSISGSQRSTAIKAFTGEHGAEFQERLDRLMQIGAGLRKDERPRGPA